MEPTEADTLLYKLPTTLSRFFTTICIIDVFGVFPIVSLTKPVVDCGYYGVLVVLFIIALQIYTAILLVKCYFIMVETKISTDNSRCPYSLLAEITYGKQISRCVSVLLNVTIFCGWIPNLLVASQTFQRLKFNVGEGEREISLCYWLIITGVLLCPIFWFGGPKDLKIICSLSAIVVVFVFVLLFSTIILDEQQERSLIFNSTTNDTTWENILSLYGVLSFQFDIHPSILIIYNDMKQKSEMHQALIGGFLVTLFMFSFITIVSFVKYGVLVKDNIVNNLPISITSNIISALIAVQLCLSSAIGNNALYQMLEDYLHISRDFNAKRCLLRTIVVLIGVVLAESVPKFDFVMSLIGGTLTGPLIFVFPPLFYIKMLILKCKHIGFKVKIEILLCGSIASFGTLITLLTTHKNVSDAFSYVLFVKPCILNATSGFV